MAELKPISRNPRFQDLRGRSFGRLTIIEHRGYDKWFCKCTCGTEKIVRSVQLRNGLTKSCGCIQREMLIKRNKRNALHGKTKTPEFKVWNAMIARCENPHNASYSRYGARGISVCERWRISFMSFLEDMGPRPSKSHSIERKENSKNYEKDNCVWATPKEQGRNRDTNVVVEFRGQRHCITEWAELLGISRQLLYHRLSRGWTPERAFTDPVRRRNASELKQKRLLDL